MTYDLDLTGDYWMLADDIDDVQPASCFEYGAAVAGMRPLDYEPDVDDYEYLQSLLYS